MSATFHWWRRALWALALALATGGPATAGGTPDLTSVAVGRFDQDDVGINLLWFDQGSSAGDDEAWSLRLEHRFGRDLAWQPYHWIALRPWISAEVTTDAAVWGGAGGIVDLRTGPWVFSASLGAGLYDRGRGKELGFPLEFRTGFEAGWEFDNHWRVTGGYYHMSNNEIRPDNNPGANSLLLYLHVPDLLGR